MSKVSFKFSRGQWVEHTRLLFWLYNAIVCFRRSCWLQNKRIFFKIVIFQFIYTIWHYATIYAQICRIVKMLNGPNWSFFPSQLNIIYLFSYHNWAWAMASDKLVTLRKISQIGVRLPEIICFVELIWKILSAISKTKKKTAICPSNMTQNHD